MNDRDFRHLFEKTRVPECPRKGMNQYFNTVQGARELLEELREDGWLPPAELRPSLDPDLTRLAISMSDLAVDLVHGGLIWNVVEEFNLEHFGSPLPLIWLEGNESLEVLDPRRFQFYLFTIWSFFDNDAYLDPNDECLQWIAKEMAHYLKSELEIFTPPPYANTYLNKANEPGWLLKQKLVWLGTNSYLASFESWWHILKQQAEAIHMGKSFVPQEAMDELVCEHSSRWSGLTYPEILSSLLQLSEIETANLLKWQKRLIGCYNLLSLEGTGSRLSGMRLKSVINHQDYSVRVDMPRSKWTCRTGGIVMGALVPWEGAWYWSGSQTVYNDLEISEEALRDKFVNSVSKYAYRLLPERMAQAREMAQEMNDDRAAFFGGRFVVFNNGKELGERERARTLAWNRRQTPEDEEPRVVPEEGGFAFSNMPGRIGVFLDDLGGMEILPEFEVLESAFGKEEGEMSPDEGNSMLSMLLSENTSAQFIGHLIERFGARGIVSFYKLPNGEKDIPFLLHMFKGSNYHPQEPGITLVGDKP